MKELKDELSNLIENNKLDQAIKILKEESAKRGGGLDNIIISLSSRYKRYKEKSLMGLEARDQEFTKIVSDALDLVKIIDDPSQVINSESESAANYRQPAYSNAPAAPPQKSNKLVQMGITGLAILGFITLIFIFVGEDEPATTDNHQETFTEANPGAYVAPNVYGNWIQIAQNWGPDYDCQGCTMSIAQDGDAISISSSEGWFASLDYIGEEGIFQGVLNWGDQYPDEPEQDVEIYWDENDNLIIATVYQGSEYDMTFAQN